MDFRQCIADSNLALSAGDFDSALKNAELAVKLEQDKAEGYYCAGKALVSMGKPAEAVEFYKAALKINNKDGNGYFLLGYAQAMAEQTSDALRSLTRAIELNCQAVFRGQIYRIVSMHPMLQTQKADWMLRVQI